MKLNNVAKVRKGSRPHEKLLTVPSDSDFNVGDYVELIKVSEDEV